ncbi:MAG: hypothetical protein ACFE88_12675 [Candidatus Hermodarchaeota archaeon]
MFNVKANPPTRMELTYDPSPNLLTIELTHEVGSESPLLQYTSEVEVQVNSIWYSTHNYSVHPGVCDWTYNYTVTAQIGDLITVIARCSIMGSGTKELYVGDGTTTTKVKEEPSVPSYIGIWLIMGVSLIIILALMRKRIRWKYKK